jgi:aspartyl/asparaginyl beta-hydroxylase (cupin superfamily)
MTAPSKPAAKSPVLRRLLKRAWHAVDLNGRYCKAAGGENRPPFYDIDKIYPSLRVLDRNYAVIREEMEAVLVYKERIPRYHDIAKNETYISGTIDPEKAWKVFMLRSMAGTPKTNQAKCPRTTVLLAEIPNLYQAFFSILDPGKSIPAHSGDYRGYLRYHLGLRVPRNNPPTMRVKDQYHTWEEGRSIVFDDSLNHEVYNKSADLRVVLIVDFLRPMPLPLHSANWILTHLLMRQSEEAKQFMADIEKYS